MAAERLPLRKTREILRLKFQAGLVVPPRFPYSSGR